MILLRKIKIVQTIHQITVGEIMGSRNQIFIGQLSHKNKSTGKLLVKADKRQELGGTNQLIYWQWYGKKIKNMDGWFGVSDPYLRFFKWHKNSDWLMIKYKSFRDQYDLAQILKSQ